MTCLFSGPGMVIDMVMVMGIIMVTTTLMTTTKKTMIMKTIKKIYI